MLSGSAKFLYFKSFCFIVLFLRTFSVPDEGLNKALFSAKLKKRFYFLAGILFPLDFKSYFCGVKFIMKTMDDYHQQY